MSTHRQSDGVGLFTSNSIAKYTPTGSKVLNKLVVLARPSLLASKPHGTLREEHPGYHS